MLLLVIIKEVLHRRLYRIGVMMIALYYILQLAMSNESELINFQFKEVVLINLT